ncbi:MAG: hypothetical protein ABWY56_09410, partial [Propionibacteriaceae bacterium]
PVAVIRGLASQLVDPDSAPADVETRAAQLNRDEGQDMFRYGSREAVLLAVLRATGQAGAYEATLAEPGEPEMVERVVAGSGRVGAEAQLLRDILTAALID